MSEEFEAYLVSKEEYNKKIAEYQSKLAEYRKDLAQNQWQYIDKKRQLETVTSRGQRGCVGGGTSCLSFIDESKRKFYEEISPAINAKINRTQRELDNYIFKVREAEQQKVIADIQKAISEQVREEELRIARELEEKRKAELAKIPEQKITTNEFVSKIDEKKDNKNFGLLALGGLLLLS